ncbi:hypothetical protein R6Q59_004039 [Mikania micrantha]
MPRSSRSKSHKQSKHSSKEASTARGYSGSDEDVKVKNRSSNGGKEDVVSAKTSKDSLVSGERAKLSKDLFNTHGNGDASEKSHGGSDRWNGGSSDDKGLLVNNENKESLKSKDISKAVGESKSKSSRRHDADSVSLIEPEKDEIRSASGNRSEKRKSEKESARKESSQYKEHRGSKDKDRGSDRGKKTNSEKIGAETPLKQVENQSSRRGKEISEWPIEEELRNPELEKELERRMRRRGEASNDKDKYQDDIKETEDRRYSTRNDHSKDERHKNEEYRDRETRKKDEKHREDTERDRKNRDAKHRGESERYSNHRDGKYDKYREDKYGEDGNKETKYKNDKYIDIISDKDERNRDGKRKKDDDRDHRHKEEKRAHDSKYGDVPEAKRLRDDNVGTDLYYRKTSNRDGSPVYDDRASRYKDDKDRRRGDEKDESSDYRPRGSMKEQRSELEKRSSAKNDLVSERGRLGSQNADVEITISHSRHRSSPSGSSYPTRDHHRVSKQEETKYRDYAYEDRARRNDHSSRDYSSAPGQSDKKATSKDDSYMGGDLSGEKQMLPEYRSSPLVDKSPSSSNEHRNLIKSDARKNLDIEESGQGLDSGGTKDTFKDGKGSRELQNEAHRNNDFSQIDNDNLSVSSPYGRNSHFSGNSKSLLPPASPSTFRTVSDSLFFGSAEDEKSKSNNRHRRMVDPNMNRGQNQIQSQGNWKNVPNWPPPMATGGYIPFHPVPPPMFHPLMQQFPPPMFGRPPMKLNPGLPHHAPDHGRPLGWRNQVDESVPPSLHGWDVNNSVFGDEAHLYGRLDWDRRSQLSNHGWDQSGDIWKGQQKDEVQLGQQKDEYSGHIPNDENLSRSAGQLDENEQSQLDNQPETLNFDKNDPEPQKPSGSPKIFEAVKEDNNAVITHAYLSRVDVSKDLTQPELYDQCTIMMDLVPEDFIQPVELDCKILYLQESVEADNASIFAAINNSVFQKAMSLYKKQREELHSMNTKTEKSGSDDDGKSAEEVAAAEDTVMEVNKENDGPSNKLEEPMDVEVDRAVVRQEEVPESTVAEIKESLSPSASGGLLPFKAEDAINNDSNDGDSLVLSDVSTAEVAVLPAESIEFGSVNLNRIHHHSPESTH